MNKLIAISAVFFLSACSSSKPLAPQIIVKDSVVYNETVVLKTDSVYLPGDTVQLLYRIPCPDVKLDTVIKKGNTVLSATILNGFLRFNCETDSLLKVIDSITRLKQKEIYSTRTVMVPQTIIKYKTPKWCWYLLIACVIYLGIKFRNPIASFIKSTFK